MTDIKRKQDRVIQTLLLVCYVLFMVYYFYRYAFKYNSEGTSPTYSNTPAPLQVGKYLIAIFFIVSLFLLFTLYAYKFRFKNRELLIATAFIVVVVKSVFFSSFDFLIKFFIFLIPAYCVLLIRDDSTFLKRFVRINKYLLVYFVLYSLLQIFLYVTIKRLPALGYANSLVRFGGPWDDPNAFGIYLIIPISYYSYYLFSRDNNRYKNPKTVLLLVLLLALLLLTFSFATYLAVAIFSIILFLTHFKNPKVRIFGFFGILAMGVGIFILRDLVISLFKLKGESALSHLQMLIPTITRDNKVFGFLIGNNEYVFSENFYNIVFTNFGIFALIIYVYVIFHICLASKKVFKQNPNAITFSAYIFLLCFSICQVGIPYHIVFPVNFIFMLFAFYVLKVKEGKFDAFFEDNKETNMNDKKEQELVLVHEE